MKTKTTGNTPRDNVAADGADMPVTGSLNRKAIWFPELYRRKASPKACVPD